MRRPESIPGALRMTLSGHDTIRTGGPARRVHRAVRPFARRRRRAPKGLANNSAADEPATAGVVGKVALPE
jgi:hypothetical protein